MINWVLTEQQFINIVVIIIIIIIVKALCPCLYIFLFQQFSYVYIWRCTYQFSELVMNHKTSCSLSSIGKCIYYVQKKTCSRLAKYVTGMSMCICFMSFPNKPIENIINMYKGPMLFMSFFQP